MAPWFPPPRESGEALVSESAGDFGRAFWFARCCQGYSVMAAFYLPLPDANKIAELFIRDTSSFHSLIATLFPAYNQVYQNLILGRAAVFSAAWKEGIGFVFEEIRALSYNPQKIVASFRLDET